MLKTKTFYLIDEGTNAIIGKCDNRIVANHLRKGFYDAQLIGTTLENHETLGGYDLKKGQFINLPRGEVLDKIRLFDLRLPAFREWMSIVTMMIDRHVDNFFVDMSHEFSECLANDYYLGEYAEVSAQTVDETRDQMRLALIEKTKTKLMIHGMAMKFSRLINLATTDGEIVSTVTKLKVEMLRRIT